MNAIASSPADALPQDELPLTDRLRAALDLLEAIEADRAVLDTLPEDDRVRFHQVVAEKCLFRTNGTMLLEESHLCRLISK